jgi:tetratricopeptide (TPR) repeat protein
MSRAVRTGLLSIWAVLTCPGLGAGQRLPEGVLIIPPLPADPVADSAYVVEMAQRLRDRLSPWRPDLIRTIWYCSLSDNCQALLTTEAARAQAAILLADILVVGTFERDSGAPRADLSVIEMGLRGGIPHFTASLSVQADSGVTPDGFAGIVNGILRDTLSNVVRAARNSRGCWVGVMDEDYAGARGRAEDAFARRRNHPSAALCLSFMFRFTQQQDSMVWALERAAAGDSMLTRAWEGLGEEYLRRGDTARAMDARTREVQSDPGNVLRRLRIAGLMDRLGRHETAVQIMRDGTRHYGSDAEFRRLLARMCLKYRMWRCALDAITERYALDSTLPGDTTIYVQAIGLAQTLSDSGAVDWWTQEAVTQVHTVVSDAWRRAERYREAAEQAERVFRSFQMARAVALADAGARDSAVAMYRRVWEAELSSPHRSSETADGWNRTDLRICNRGRLGGARVGGLSLDIGCRGFG